jgi:hypothetical protein
MNESTGRKRRMRTVGIHEAKAHLSRLVEEAAAGEVAATVFLAAETNQSAFP